MQVKRLAWKRAENVKDRNPQIWKKYALRNIIFQLFLGAKDKWQIWASAHLYVTSSVGHLRMSFHGYSERLRGSNSEKVFVEKIKQNRSRRRQSI
ncbi:hypothetical protein VNO80_21135 [Phaseolus coccineus]|uniref:Uncharacterized protein n=1 Tax=Phaseolus coccineus TaxID=3886 RepID=A0AAN9M7B3_PHACN